MKYVKRIADKQIKDALRIAGGVLIAGPKACGKTESAKQVAKSQVNLSTDPNVQTAMETDPRVLLAGAVPRLLDEWQTYPIIWNYVRHEIDNRRDTGQFILTGSSTPRPDEKIHSGAGRISRVKMRPMSWSELGYSDGSVSLKELTSGILATKPKIYDLPLDKTAEYIAVGGWPTNLEKPVNASLRLNREYVDLLAETDLAVIAGAYRDPLRVKKLLESYARNIATPAKIATLVSDTAGAEDASFTAETAVKYLEELTRLMIVEDLPVWPTHICSSAKLRQTPKRHFVDPALAVAALGLTPESLINELRFMGFLFESEVVRDVRIYAEQNDLEVYYYRDTDNDEVDIVVEKRSGEFALIEVKLGIGGGGEGAKQISRVVAKLPDNKLRFLQARIIIVGSGMCYTRPEDGIHVVPLCALGV